MSDRLDLPLRYRRQLEALLHEHLPGVEAWAYGSRATRSRLPLDDTPLRLPAFT